MLTPSLGEDHSGETSVDAWLQTLNNGGLAQYHNAVISDFGTLDQLSLAWVGNDELGVRGDVTDGVDTVFWEVVPVETAYLRQLLAAAIRDLHIVYTSSSRVKRLRMS